MNRNIFDVLESMTKECLRWMFDNEVYRQLAKLLSKLSYVNTPTIDRSSVKGTADMNAITADTSAVVKVHSRNGKAHKTVLKIVSYSSCTQQGQML